MEREDFRRAIEEKVKGGRENLFPKTLKEGSEDQFTDAAAAYVLGANAIATALGVHVKWKTGMSPQDLPMVDLYVSFYGDKNAKA